MKPAPLVIDYYTDILCIWAWIAQRRVDELHQQFGDQIEIRHHYLDLFGDVPTKMRNQWDHRGGYAAFAEHVKEAASEFDDAPVNKQIWQSVKPITSSNAHLILKAISLTCGEQASIEAGLVLRKAFFVDAQDIGNLDVLFELIKPLDLDHEAVSTSIRDGSAIAALMCDSQKARQQNIKGSPSYVMDGGRQTLYGNVGYRVLSANIEELLKNPADEASWC